LRPRIRRDRSRVHQHLEAPQQPNLKLPHTDQPYRRPQPPLCRTQLLTLSRGNRASASIYCGRDRR
jgi:hypothetical protein